MMKTIFRLHMMSGKSIKFIWVFAMIMGLSTWAGGQVIRPDEGKYAIYGSDAPLPVYARDQQWEAFYQHGTLSSQIIGEDDIEFYDWDNQALVLTENASARHSGRVGQFIAVLGDKRLYGGKGLDRISQMAVEHTVIYLERIENRTVLLIRPYHDFGRRPKLPDKRWEIIASPEVKSRFEYLGKLRHPWSEKSYVDLQKSVHRIHSLHATAAASALEAEYDLDGTRQGDYYLREELEWVVGNESKSFGPTRENTMTLNAKSIQRKVAFLYDDIAQRYGKYGELRPELTENQMQKPVWRITVRIWPVLNKGELASLGLVEKINLDLLVGYGGELFDQIERNTGQQWSSVGDMKVVELPVEWHKIRRSMTK